MAEGRLAVEQVSFVAFEEVVVYFSPEEWVELAEWQKELYQDVMAENYELVSSLECLLAIPELLSQLLRGEALSSPGTPSPARNSYSQVNDILSLKGVERATNTLPPPEPGSDLLRGIRPHHSQTARKGSRRPISPAQQKPGGAGRCAEESSTQNPKSRKRTKPYKCPKCQRRFLGRPALSAHRRLHLRKWPRICFQGKARRSHTPDSVVPLEGQLGTGASPLPCSQGQGTLPFWPEMALHHQAPVAHSFNPWSLGYGPQPLPGHQAPGLHSNGEFICDQCGWSFHGWEELVTHQMAHMAAAEGIAGSVPKAGALSQLASDRPYACTQCGKSFRHKPNLLAHRQVHTGERRYQCQECGKSFGSKAYLASHQHIHTGEKPYVCGQCGKSFRHKPNLISHQKIHTREPLPAPSHPLDAFTGENFQSQHLMLDSLGLEVFQPGRPLADTHLPSPQSEALVPQLPGTLPSPQPQVDRPFVCPVCAKQFRCKPYLVAHIRIHTGEKPYACSRCPKRFSQKSNLVSHERLHTGEKPYACPLCPRVFSQGSNMRAHQRSHRNVGHGEVGGCLRPQQGYSHQPQPPN